MIAILSLTGLWLVGAGCARAETGYTMHAGEWQNSVEFLKGEPPVVTLVCKKKDQIMDAATFAAIMGRMPAHCDVPAFSNDGNTLTIGMTCDIGGGRLTTHTVATLDGPDAITSHTTSHMEGGRVKMPDGDMVSHARRLGPCQPGDRPEPDFTTHARH